MARSSSEGSMRQGLWVGIPSPFWRVRGPPKSYRATERIHQRSSVKDYLVEAIFVSVSRSNKVPLRGEAMLLRNTERKAPYIVRRLLTDQTGTICLTLDLLPFL